MKVSIVSLGCSKNLVDSELIIGNLKEKGHLITQVEDAEAIILNTCGFIGDAKKESINTALELVDYKKNGECKKLILTGCLIERYSDQLKKEIPEIDAFWGTGELNRIHTLLDDEQDDFKNYRPGSLYDPDSPRELLTSSHTAYVKVSEGCSRTCTFCIIPKMRGLMKSREIESIKKEITDLADRGVKEINLIAQDMTSYGRDIKADLEELLLEISSVNNIEWLRLHYLYPWGMNDSLMKVINNEEKIVPYIDMPLQHINDRLLKLMDRRTTRKKTIDIIERLRDNIENLTLRSTFIVGFPTESDDEFQELLEFIEDYKFDRAGAFKYSQEEGTPAAMLDGQITEEVKEDRLEILMNLQSEVSFQINSGYIGTTQEGIIEGRDEGKLIARISSQAPEVDGITYVDSDNEKLIGSIVKLNITDCDVYDLYAELDS